jgi:cold shock CspA family protein
MKQYYVGDKVQFNVCTCVKTKKQYAVNIKLVEARKDSGYITMIKDNYGFIELNVLSNLNENKRLVMPRDMFFHFSSLQFSSNDLDVGDEVEFIINRKNKNKLCAENVTKLSSGTVKPLNVSGLF